MGLGFGLGFGFGFRFRFGLGLRAQTSNDVLRPEYRSLKRGVRAWIG